MFGSGIAEDEPSKVSRKNGDKNFSVRVKPYFEYFAQIPLQNISSAEVDLCVRVVEEACCFAAPSVPAVSR